MVDVAVDVDVVVSSHWDVSYGHSSLVAFVNLLAGMVKRNLAQFDANHLRS